LLATGKVFITGRYTEGEVPHLLRREQPQVLWFPIVVPETWCYTLTHALATDLPIMAFDIGAVAERLRHAARGLLLPLDTTAEALNARLIQLASGSPRDMLNRQDAELQKPEKTLPFDFLMSPPTEDLKAVPNDVKHHAAIDAAAEGLSASLQVLPLPGGLYLFSVGAGSPTQTPHSANLTLPAVHVGLGPGVSPSQVEFVSGLSNSGSWLFATGDLLVARVAAQGATLILTSVRGPGGQILSIKVERLESRKEAAPDTLPAPAPASLVPPSSAPELIDADAVRMRIGAHVRLRGDMTFDTPWAGRVAPGLWIESFSVSPLGAAWGATAGPFSASDLEYKGLAANGFETPWLSDGNMCGTKGMSVPLVGFAVRLKRGPAGASHHCEYSGYFKSGVIVGPMRNGAPCRSTAPNDPLEGIQVRITRRQGVLDPYRASPTDSPDGDRTQPSPLFSKFREDEDAKISTQQAAAFESDAALNRQQRR